MSDISFEYSVPVFAGVPDGGTEPTYRNTPQYEALDWVMTKIGVQKAEELGFDAVWVPNHLLLGCDYAEYECWTLLLAIVSFTENINLGPLVPCNNYHSPALVAKMAATLDVISDEWLELGPGTGWHELEYDAHGREYRDGLERLIQLDESIRLMKYMWAAGTDDASFDGKHYQTEDAYYVPGPIQGPHPSILAGGQGEEVMPKLVTKYADVWSTDVFSGDVETLEHKIGVIGDHYDTVDRDPDDIEHSWDGHAICACDEEKFDRPLDLMVSIRFEAEYQDQASIVIEEGAREYFVMGTPEECMKAIECRIDAGVTKFQGWFTDFPDTGGMELFVDEAIPQFS